MSSLPGAICRIKVSNRKVITQLATASCLTREHKKVTVMVGGWRHGGAIVHSFGKYFRSRVENRRESFFNYKNTRFCDITDERLHPKSFN